MPRLNSPEYAIISPNYTNDATDAYNACKKSFNKEANLLRSLSLLKDYCLELASFAEDYDFPGVPCNGYRTTIDIAIRLMKYGADNFDESTPSDIDYRKMVAMFLCGMSFYRQIHQKTKDMEIGSNKKLRLYDDDHHLACESFAAYLDRSAMDGGLGSMIGFYYNFPENIICQLGRFALACVAAGNIWQTISSLFDANQRRENIRYLATNIRTDHIKRIDIIADSWYVRTVSPLAMSIFHPNRCSTIFVPRQTKYKLVCDPEKQSVQLIRRSPSSAVPESDTVRCRLLFDDVRGRDPDGSIVLHVHGGGFVMGSPDCHESYTRYWVSQFPGVAFISVDYGLSPGTQFPESLQQVLDVFLWLNSKESKSVIGYPPKRIICVGDSSGGLFLMAMMCILNDIKIMFPEDAKDPSSFFSMPKGFVGIYPSFSCCPRASPSLFLAGIHPELIPGAFLNMVTSYVPGPNAAINNHYRSETQRDTSSRLNSFIQWLLPQSFGGGGWFGKDSQEKRPRTNWKPKKSKKEQEVDEGYNEGDSNETNNNRNDIQTTGTASSSRQNRSGSYIVDKFWWNQSDEISKKFLDDWKLLNHPYVSPLYYDKFEDLKDIPISLLACPTDPIIDHAVSMANQWKGEVKLQTFDNMIHAFLPMIWMKGIYLDYNDLCVKEIKRLLKYKYD